MKLVQTCLCAGNTLNAVYTAEVGCEARAGLFTCQKSWRNQFSPLWRSCEAGANMFMCGKHPIKPFSPPR